MRADPFNRPDNLPEDGTEPAHEPVEPEKEPGHTPAGEPGNRWDTPEAERPPRPQEGVVSDPDACGCGPESVQEVSGL